MKFWPSPTPKMHQQSVQVKSPLNAREGGSLFLFNHFFYVQIFFKNIWRLMFLVQNSFKNVPLIPFFNLWKKPRNFSIGSWNRLLTGLVVTLTYFSILSLLLEGDLKLNLLFSLSSFDRTIIVDMNMEVLISSIKPIGRKNQIPFAVLPIRI